MNSDSVIEQQRAAAANHIRAEDLQNWKEGYQTL